MRYFIFIALLLCGCQFYHPGQVITGGNGLALVKFEDPDNNVVCYRPESRDGIFCFKKGELK